jgi:RNase P/RNase MRP subunit p30
MDNLLMNNYLLLKYSPELEQYSKRLGFSNTYFLEKDFILISNPNSRKVLAQARDARKMDLQVIFQPRDESQLLFAVENKDIQVLIGLESLFSSDSLFQVRSGLDTFLCRQLASHDKKLAFSFSDLINSGSQAKVMARMRFNLKLCRKYKIPIIFSSFARSREEMRSRKDLELFFRNV